MARNASKKTSTSNQFTLTLLFYGFLFVNLFHIVVRFGLFRHGLTLSHTIKYALTEAVAMFFWSQLRTMARQGQDISVSQGGLTSYMLDVIYVTWFVHFLTTWWSSVGWWVYAVIPAYALYLLYTKVMLPYFFKGQSPFSSLSNFFSSSASNTQQGDQDATATTATTNKRQAKLQARAERGDARVKMRSR